MQLIYRGQPYSYPYSETVESSANQPLCIYRGVKTSIVPIAPKSTSSEVQSLRYRGITYLRTLTSAFN